MKLDELRKIIDQVDEKIIQLLNERCKIAGRVGVWKIENEHPIFVPEREKALFEKIIKQNKGPISDESLKYVYREIISGSIALEKPLKIGYSLHENSSQIRHPARLTFGDSAEYILSDSIHEIFLKIENNDINYGVVPFYDGNDCFNNETVNELLKTNMNIVAERISQNDGYSSLIIGEQSPENSGDDRTAFRIEVTKDDENLKAVMTILEEREIEIVCCELRISQDNPETNLVFIEVIGHTAEKRIKSALKSIEEKSLKTRILGGFPIL